MVTKGYKVKGNSKLKTLLLLFPNFSVTLKLVYVLNVLYKMGFIVPSFLT